MDRLTDDEIKYRAIQRYKAFRRVLKAKSCVPDFFGYSQIFSIDGVSVEFRRQYNGYLAIMIDHGNCWGEGSNADAAFRHLRTKLEERIKNGLHAFITEAYRRNIRGRNQLARLRQRKRTGYIYLID